MTRRVGIAILARAPLAGQAKTRLVPRLGASGAARLQDWMIRRSVTTARAAGVGPLSLWCTPDTGHPCFADCAAAGDVHLRTQPAGDLGQRMLAAIAAGPELAGTLLIGTDCPLLDAGRLQEAAAVIDATGEVVLIPAEDGGYGLIGLPRPLPELFANVAWGGPLVMATTRQRLAAAGLRWTELAPCWDVDRPADYERLLAALPEVATVVAPPGPV